MGADRRDPTRRWLKVLTPGSLARDIRLFCFHYAGGSAAMFRAWPDRLPSTVGVVGVQLPGRADRFNEPAYTDMASLVGDLALVLRPFLDRPYAFFGVSMGARVAWTLTHRLWAQGHPLPQILYVAASGGPRRDDGDWRWEGRTDGLEGYVREMGGTPAAVLAEPALLAALLPTLRADLTVLSTHDRRPTVPLPVPIRAFAGRADDEATPERMAAWREETSAGWAIEVLDCGHFFDDAAEQRLVATVGAELDRLPRPSPAANGSRG
jgi:surfactin synthase thioesterase subunit